MKFAHLADCHIGSWQRTPKLADASVNAFVKAMDVCVERKVDFILISGDLFDTSIPAVDKLKEAVLKLKEIKDRGVPVYLIAGSHDYSPTGKTMLDVLEGAGLFENVCKMRTEADKVMLKFTVDKKTGAKITGMRGKKGGLEKAWFSELSKKELENEQGFKIFMLHSGIEEYKTGNMQYMDLVPLSDIPKSFDYYASGHIHQVFSKEEPGYGIIAFPGPLFPNNFEELENLGNGGFYIVDADMDSAYADDGECRIKMEYVPIIIHNFQSISIDCSGKTPMQIQEALLEHSKGSELINTILGIRLYGTIKGGRTTDINFKEIFNALHNKGCHCILRNTSALTSEFFEEVKTESGSVEDVETAIISQHLGKIKLFEKEKEFEITKELIVTLSREKEEGERQADFERRIIEDVEKVLRIKL